MIKVIHSVSIMNRAGQETLLMNIYRRIDREKIQFDFQCSDSRAGDYDAEIKKLGGEILYLGENKIRIPYLKYLGDVVLQYKFFKKYSEYDVFHIHTYHAFNAWLCIVGAKLAGMRHIILHSHNSQGMHPGLHKIFRKALGAMKIERYACSREAAEWMFGKKCVKKNQVHIVKNGIVPEEFAFSEAGRKAKRKELNIEDKVTIGHIGRFAKQKNHEFLLGIFKEFVKLEKNAVLLLIGDGELRPFIQKKAEELGVLEKVKFLGIREDIKELLWAMDVFVFPSLYEGLGISAVEAQAAGLPCLLSTGVPTECKMTDDVEFLSLEVSAEVWAEQMRKICKQGHLNTERAINRAGYNINETVQFLENNYCIIAVTGVKNNRRSI